jgi:hypothetical protein
MVNATPASELAVHLPVSSSLATAAPPAEPCVISCEIGPADRQAVLDLFARSSPDTRRSRFHHALSVFPLVNRVAPEAITRFEDGMIVVSVPLPDLAAASGARS